ncbi:uncharacterized protein lrrfip1a isoform 3-T3 [Odontesthes bonariensis]|uniref:uncharacterized protein lrrfip1a isoform X3 n=1 Tax=Odontesthes bonariensis TaxID=219752 RepID=UPI003F5875D7
MGTQGTGRKRSTKKERSTAEDDALNLIAREAEARLAAKRAARAEAREIRMKELERQQKEIYQVQKKYYGLDTKLDDRADGKWGDIEQWMEDSEKFSRSSRIHTLSDDDERMSVGSRGSVRSDLDSVGAYGGGGSSLHKKSKKKKKHKHKDRDRNGNDDDYSVMSGRSSRLSDESRVSRSSRIDLTSPRLGDDSRVSRSSRLDLQPASYASADLYSLNVQSSSRHLGSAFNGYQNSLYEDSLCSGSRRVASATSHPLEYTSYRSPSSRASSRASSARASPVDNCSSVASFLRSAASSSSLPRDLDDLTIPDFSHVEDREFPEKGSRAASALTAATLTSLGGTSSRRGSGETALTVDAESSLREIKDAFAEVEEKYRKAMVSNAQLDNDKNNLMYQVDTLKDSLMELEELLSESRREYEEKAKEYEREKYAHGVLQFQFNEMKETLKQSEELLNEIRQLRLKQNGFVSEISDLQETVEWKDKKIGALERQKEYTDPIRIERDELREEVVTLKDILKKHGIILGPDLNINGDAGEAEVDRSPDAEPSSHSAPDSQTTPTEGNSMLGNTEETELRAYKEEEVDPEQQQQMLEEDKENRLSSDKLCHVADMSALGSCIEKAEDQQTCLPIEDVSSKNLTAHPITKANDVNVVGSHFKEILTSHVENVPQTEGSEGDSTSHSEVMETETQSVDTHGDHVREARNNHFEKQPKKQEDGEESSLTRTESCPQQRVAQVVVKKSLADELTPAASNTEPQQEPEKTEEAENDESEEMPNKSQSQASMTSGKKKKKKRRGKKKGGTHDDKNQQKSGTDKENKSEKESATKINRSATETDNEGSITETVKASKSDQVKNEQDKQEPEEVEAAESIKPIESFSDKEVVQEPSMDNVSDEDREGKTVDFKTLEEVVSTDMPCLIKTPNEMIVDQVKDVENKEETLETDIVESVEAAGQIESYPLVETFQESTTNSTLTEEKDKLTFETEKVDEIGFEISPDPEANLLLSDITQTEVIEGPDKGRSSTSSSEVIHTESLDEIKSDCTVNNPESSFKTGCDKITEAETDVPSDGDIPADDSGSTNSSESKDNASASLPSPDVFTEVSKSMSDSEPSAAVHSGSNSIPTARPDKGPEEAVADDCELDAETVHEGIPHSTVSPTHDSDDSELRRNKTGAEELNGDIREAEDLAEPDNSLQREDSCASVATNNEAFEVEKTLQRMGRAVNLNAEVEIKETDAVGLLKTTLCPKEASVVDSSVEQESAFPENPELKKGHDNEETELKESNRVKCEGNDSPRQPELDADEDNGEDEEGQSFDFDDMDMEMATVPHVSNDPEQEEVEEGVEVTSDEISISSSELCQSVIETKQNTEERAADGINKNCTVDGGCWVDALDKESDAFPQVSQKSLPLEEGACDKVETECGEKQIATKEEVGDKPRPVAEQGRSLNIEDLAVVPENIKQTVSSPVEDGLDAAKLQREDSEFRNVANQVTGNREALQSAKDAKRSGKKGKSKGKEDCKMS